jgi:hypothetical protein
MRAVAHGKIVNDAGAIVDVKYAAIGTATSGDNTIVAAVTGKKIRVVSLYLHAAGDVDVYVVDGANNDMIGKSTQALDLTTNSGCVLPYNPGGWAETASGQTLDINLGGNVRVAGVLSYVEI